LLCSSANFSIFKGAAVMDLNLEGKRALVCGSSQGIGLASAIELASLGASVTLVSRSEEKLVKALEQLPGSGHDFLAIDLNDSDAIRELVGPSHKKSPYSILVNNSAGPKGGPIEFADPDDFVAAFKQHLLAASIISKIVLPEMKSIGFGRIINIISTSVKTPLMGLGVSNTIRSAVASWGKTLSLEVAPFGVTVNSVLPGATATSRLDSLLESWAQKSGCSVEEEATKRKAAIPAGRFGEPSEVASVVAFLSSPAAAYVNGVALSVDGGRTACL